MNSSELLYLSTTTKANWWWGLRVRFRVTALVLEGLLRIFGHASYRLFKRYPLDASHCVT